MWSWSLLKKSVPLAGALALMSAGVAHAQDTLDVKVPFPFVVHGKSLPAGQYSVRRDGPVLLIQGERGTRGNVVVLTTPSGGHDPAGETPVLTFDRYENTYKLTGVWESKNEGQTVAGR